MTSLKEAYDAYIKARQNLKKDMRDRYDDEHEGILVSLGAAISEAQDRGASMTSIANEMGVTNRNLLYDAKRAYEPRTDVMDRIIRDAKNASQWDAQNVPSGAQWTIQTVGPGEYEVTIADEAWVLATDEDTGRMIAPEEWATASKEERDIYKKVLAEVEELHGQA